MKTTKSSLSLALVCILSLSACTMSKTEKTIENVKLGIENETTASVKYAAYAQKAWVEGLDTIAKLFQAASKAEAIHASNHAAVLKTLRAEMSEFVPQFSVKSTQENLEDAIYKEKDEVENMYPQFLLDAKSKKIKKATIESLEWSLATEKKHVDLFVKALDALKNKTEYKLPFEYSVCPVCGNTFDNTSIPDTCDLCGGSKILFLTIK